MFGIHKVQLVLATTPYGHYKNLSSTEMPWPVNLHDLSHFASVTTNSVLVMGFRTYLATPKPILNTLNRQYFVISNSDLVPRFNQIKNINQLNEKLFFPKTLSIIGGKKLWLETADLADVVYHTIINNPYVDECNESVIPIDKLFKNKKLMFSTKPYGKNCEINTWVR